MFTQKLRLWLLLGLALAFFLWFFKQQTPTLPLSSSVNRLTSSTFYEVTVSTYATNSASFEDKTLKLPLQQQASLEKLTLDATPEATFSRLQGQWQGFTLNAKTGFGQEQQIFLEEVTLRSPTFHLNVPKLTIQLPEQTARAQGLITWQYGLSHGQAKAFTYQYSKLTLHEVEDFIYLNNAPNTPSFIQEE